MGGTLRMLGYSYNSKDESQIKQAYEKLKALNLRSQRLTRLLGKIKFWQGICWRCVTRQMRSE